MAPPPYSLAYLTVARLTPPEAVDVAAATGYRYVGLRLMPALPGGAAFPLHTNAGLLRATQDRMRETGVGVFDLEIVRIEPDFSVDAYRGFMEAGQKLGAKAILVAGNDPDEARLTASFARLCEVAAAHGLTCDLEFMPWTEVRNAATATRLVLASGQPNARVLVDALHFARSATTLDDIAAIPRDRLSYAQICDAPAGTPATVAEMIHTARQERMLPGEGGIDLVGLFSNLPEGLPVSVEIPSETRVPQLGEQEWARQALERSKAILGRVHFR